MYQKTVAQRLAALRAAMADAGCDAYLLPSSDPHASEYAPAHFTAWEYFSGFSCENSNLVVTKDSAAMWVDGRFFGAADAALNGTGIVSMHMGVRGVPTVNEWLKANLPAGSTLAYCAANMPLYRSRELENALTPCGIRLVPLSLEDTVWTEDRPALPCSEIFLLDAQYAGCGIAEKRALLQAELQKQGCTAELVCTLDSVAWLLNLRAADVKDTPYALAFCYADESGAVLFTELSRVPQAAARELAENGVTLQPYEAFEAFVRGIDKPVTLLADPACTNTALYRAAAENACITLKEGTDPVRAMKAIKNETELACTREVHLEDGAAMVRFQMELERRFGAGEAMRETDIDPILHGYRSAVKGFWGESFGTIAAVGANAAMMHYAPQKGSDAPLVNKGYLLVDSGATYLRGTTDITRTYTMGTLTEEEKLAYTRVLQSHVELALAVWPEGATGGEIDMIARQPMYRHLQDYRCGTGHGVSHVGAVHEGPYSLRPHNGSVFREGMIITDEPGLYEEGLYGIRIENEMEVVFAGDSAYGHFLKLEPLTWVPIDTAPVLTELLTAEELAWLNDYHAKVYEKLSPLLEEGERAWLAKKCKAI